MHVTLMAMATVGLRLSTYLAGLAHLGSIKVFLMKILSLTTSHTVRLDTFHRAHHMGHVQLERDQRACPPTRP